MLSVPNLELSVNVKYGNMTLTNNRLLIISHLKVLQSSILTMIFITVNLTTHQCIADIPQGLDPETNSHLQDSIPWQCSHQWPHFLHS